MAAAPDAQEPHPNRLPHPAHAVLSRLRDCRHLLRAAERAPDRRQRARPRQRRLGAPFGRHRTRHRRPSIGRRACPVARHGGGSDAARGGSERRAERVSVRVRDGRLPRSRLDAPLARRSRRSRLRDASRRPLALAPRRRSARSFSESPPRTGSRVRSRGSPRSTPGSSSSRAPRSRSLARRVSEPGSGGSSARGASSRKPVSPCASTTGRRARTRWRGQAIRSGSDRSTSLPEPTSGMRHPSPRSSWWFAPRSSPPWSRARAIRSSAGARC